MQHKPYPLPHNPDFQRELGGLFISGFEGVKAGGDIVSAIVSAIEGGLGGVILFPRNLNNPEQIRALTDGLRAASPTGKLIVSIDQEGGRVARLKAPFTEFPPMCRVKDPEIAREVGKAIGRELLAVGINLDFAPVVDLDEPDAERVIGDRSFGADPEMVGKIGAAYIEGMQSVGVAACAKHFPGHGATDRDSHVELPEVHLDKEQLEPHLAPFRAAIEAKVATMMTAHIRCHSYDVYYPATLSAELLNGVLRAKMGYDGVIITDDMGMAGIADLMPAEDAACLAMRAGADILLVAHDLNLAGKLRNIIHEAVRHLLVHPDDIFDKIDRVRALNEKFAVSSDRPGLEIIGCKEHAALAAEIASN